VGVELARAAARELPDAWVAEKRCSRLGFGVSGASLGGVPLEFDAVGADLGQIVLRLRPSSQLWALPPKTFDKRTAISGEIPRFSFTSSESVVRVTPSAAAASVMVKPKG